MDVEMKNCTIKILKELKEKLGCNTIEQAIHYLNILDKNPCDYCATMGFIQVEKEIKTENYSEENLTFIDKLTQKTILVRKECEICNGKGYR